MKRAFLAAAILLAGCSPQGSGVRAIVGAKLNPGQGRPVIEYSVIVVADGKVQAMGPQATTPVPKGAQITQGLGRVIDPAPRTSTIETGRSADLVIRNATTGQPEAVMMAGEWIK